LGPIRLKADATYILFVGLSVRGFRL